MEIINNLIQLAVTDDELDLIIATCDSYDALVEQDVIDESRKGIWLSLGHPMMISLKREATRRADKMNLST